MRVCSESKWICGQCGNVFNPMECKLEIDDMKIPMRVLIYCPNPRCGCGTEICDVLEE